jgi:hypothetical protein
VFGAINFRRRVELSPPFSFPYTVPPENTSYHRYFFPRWLKALDKWLRKKKVDYANVADWYLQWKSVPPLLSLAVPFLLASQAFGVYAKLPRIRAQFDQALHLIDMLVRQNYAAASTPSPPAAKPVAVKQEPSSADSVLLEPSALQDIKQERGPSRTTTTTPPDQSSAAAPAPEFIPL